MIFLYPFVLSLLKGVALQCLWFDQLTTNGLMNNPG